MKRFFAFAGLVAAAAISLTNCQQKEAGLDRVPSVSKTIYISASTADTKTTNDGMKTLWEDVDSLNVFYNETGSFVNLGKATIADGAGTTSATLAIDVTGPVGPPSGAATWYAFFPYQKKMETPEGTTGYAYLGHSKGVNQTGFDSMAHLRGNVCPMYAVSEGKGSTVSFSMKHLTSIVEFNVNNGSGKEIVVKSLTLTASEDIVGTYYFNLTPGEVVYTPSGESYVYKSATVNVSEDTLAAGASGKVYLPIKPYTQSSTEAFKVNVKVTVDGVDKTAELELHPTGAQCVFSAGKVKRVTLNLDSFGEDPGDSIADIHSGTVTGSVEVKNVTVVSVFPKGFFVSDGKGILYIYLNAAPSVSKGALVSVKGTVSTYKGNKQISNPTVTENGTGSVSLSPEAWTGSNVENAYVDSNAAYVSLTMNSTSTTLAAVDGTEKILYFPAAQKAEGVSIAKDKTYNVVGFIYGHALYSETNQVYIYIESASEVMTSAAISVSPTSVSIDQAGGSAEATVTCDNDNWTIDNTADWLTCTRSGSKITFSAGANEGTKRSTTVKLNHSNGTLTASVKVSQEGATVASNLSLSSNTVAFDAEPSGEKEVKVTCDNSDWTVSSAPSWLTVTLDKENSKIILAATANSSTESRSAELTVSHSNGELSRTLTVNQAGKVSGGGGSKTVKLTNQDIVNAGDGASGYSAWTITSSTGQVYHAFAIKNFHSKATAENHYLQIKKATADASYYIQIPELGTKIMSIKMTVSSASKPMTGGGNTATFFFSSSDSTKEDGDGVVSAVGDSTITLDTSSLNLNTGYITASAGTRVWDIEISYN